MKHTAQQLIDLLDQEINHLRHGMSTVKNSKRPAVNMPHEILALIFELACRSSSELRDGMRRTRWSITSVCSRWRSVGMAEQILWSSIACKHGRNSLDIWPSLASISTELELSRSNPLWIHLSSSESELPSPMEVLDLLEPHVHRCTALNLDVHNEESEKNPWYLRLIYGDMLRRMVDLRTLSISLGPCGGSTFSAIDIDLTGCNGPSIEELSISIDSPFTKGAPSFPHFPRLRHLQINGNIASSSAIQLITSCPTLEVLRWDCDRVESADNNSIVLPALHSLYISGLVPVAYLRHMSAPKLRLLMVDRISVENLRSRMPTFPSLEEFRATRWPGVSVDLYTNRGVVELLTYHPMIKRLSIADMTVDLEGFLCSKDSDRNIRVPHLQAISMPIDNDEEYDGNRIQCARRILHQRVALGRNEKFVISFRVGFRDKQALTAELEDIISDFPNNTKFVHVDRDDDYLNDVIWRFKDRGLIRNRML